MNEAYANMNAPSKLIRSPRTIKKRERIQTITDEYFASPLGSILTEIGLNFVTTYLNESVSLQKQKRENIRKKSREHTKIKALPSIKCKVCQLVTDSSLVVAHPFEIPHLKESEYLCNVCSKDSINSQEILNHEQMVHGTNPHEESREHVEMTTIKCKFCKFVTDSSLVMAHHYETPHLKESGYRCNFCSEKSIHSQEIIDHMQIAHGINAHIEKPLKPYLCPNCTFGGTQKGQLRRHRVHCDANFCLDQNLAPPLNYHKLPAYIHNRFRKNKTQQQKPISSGKVTKRSKRLATKLKEEKTNLSLSSTDDSMDIDMQPSFVECEICDEQIGTMESLYDHIKIIHAEIVSKEKMIQLKPTNLCKICKQGFYSKGGLERHYLGSHGVLTTTLERAYKKDEDCGRCPICRVSFDSGLVNHFSEEHNSDLQVLRILQECGECNERFPFMKDFNIHVRLVHGSC